MASSGGEYEVFLNFCGPDTRRGFTNSLYHALLDVGIRVFIDNEELRRGETFSSNLPQAIDDSKLYITIFSPNYASHHWCLRELAKMVENISKPEEEGNKKVILPIFYNVTPDDVKLKTDLYSKSISELEQKMEDQKKFRTEEVETWKQALKEVDAIQGWELEKYEGDGHLSKAVVEDVVNRLQKRQRKITKDLVGMDDCIADINNLLDINSGGVRLIGIYGMGGTGKTTLASIIFNQLCPHFGKNCSFLADIRETAKTKGLVTLQEKLLSDISNSKVAHNIGDIDSGTDTIQQKIRNKKVLIVLDDVDDSNQIQKLIGVNYLYPGTTIFVTTRDKSVLNIRGFQFKDYEMEGLSNQDALQLFSRHAFNDNFPPFYYYNLSKDLVSTVGGFPLALQAIGASLFDQKDKEIWEERLEGLCCKPNDDVLGKLKITYDALKSAEQDIFLDIACFFINEEKTEPIFVWRNCGFDPKSAIDVLIKRCMIKVLDNNTFWMHNQFRDLGRAIAEKGHTRLWDTTDIIRKLRSTEEKHSVQALCFRRKRYDPCITVTAKDIERFPRLRFLWLANVNLQGDFAGCLSGLKWFYLCRNTIVDNDDLPFMPTNLHLQNVVVLKTWRYEWTEDALNSLLKEATKLKVLIIHVSYSIHGIITFSKHSVLEKLELFQCPSLKISCSIGELRWLTYLELKACDALQNLPEQIGKLKHLQHLSLMDCKSLRELPNSVSKLESLTKLVALKSSITRLPSTMSKLSKLHTLDLRHCNEIQELPELPRSLTTLWLESRSLRTVPDVSNLTNLVELLLSDCSISGFHDQISHSNIIQPCDLPWSWRLSNLRKQELCLLNVRATSVEWGSFSLLEELRLTGLDLQTLKQLPSNLRVLKLHSTRLKQLELGELPNLEELIIERCEPVARISITSSLNKLRHVEVHSCSKLVEVQFLSIVKSIESISFWGCESFERLVCLSPQAPEPQAPELTNGWRRVFLVSSSLKMLQKLKLWGCPELLEVQFVSTLEALKEFFVYSCNSLKRLGGLSNLKNLNNLKIGRCEYLQVVEGIDKLECLQKLDISYCRSIERIIDASISKIPKECQIKIRRCGQLLDTGSHVSSITWECYREMILNAQTQASASAIETTFSETGDPLLEQQDDGDDDDDNEDYYREDDDDEYDEDDCSDEDNEDDEHGDHENDDSEDDEVDDVHSSHRPSLDSSMDNDDEDDDVDKEFGGEADSNSKSKDDEDRDDDNDEDKNEHEVLQSSCGLLPGCSMGDNDENNEVNEEGKGDSDSDEDRMRTRKRKRGTMQKPKRNTMTVMMTTTAATMPMTRKTMVMKATTRATTMARTTTSPWMTVCRSICSCLVGLCEFFFCGQR